MLSEAREALTDSQEEVDDGVDLDFGRLFLSAAMAEEGGLVVEELETDGKLIIPDEWALPVDFSLAPVPDPDCYTEGGYEDQSIRVRTEVQEMFNSNVNIAYVEIAHPSQLRTATAGPLNVTKANYVKTIALNNNAVIAINGDDYVKMDSKKDKSFEIRMAEPAVCTQLSLKVAPSRSAASRSSSGIVCWKKVRHTIRFQVLTAPGRISAHIVLYSPRLRTRR